MVSNQTKENLSPACCEKLVDFTWTHTTMRHAQRGAGCITGGFTAFFKDVGYLWRAMAGCLFLFILV